MNRKNSIIYFLIVFQFLGCYEETTINFTEESIGELRVENQKEIGKTPIDIVESLRSIKTYNDILEYVNGAKFNQQQIQSLAHNSFNIYETIVTKKHYKIKMSYVLHKDLISYLKLYSIDSSYQELYGEELIEINKQEAKEYLDKYNKEYGTKKSIEDFQIELLGGEKEIKLACGYSTNYYGEEEKQMVLATRRRETKHLDKLLESLKPEKKVLGLLGYRELLRQGVKVENDTEKKLEKLIERNMTIQACMNCMSDYYKLENYLKSYYWDKVFAKEFK